MAQSGSPYESEGVYYALIGGNHVMHFRQSYRKKLLRGAINGYSMYISSNNVLIEDQEGQVTNVSVQLVQGQDHSTVSFSSGKLFTSMPNMIH